MKLYKSNRRSSLEHTASRRCHVHCWGKKKKKSSKEDHGGTDHEHGAEAICKTGSPPPTETSPKQFALKILTNQCARESTTEIYLRHFNFPIRY